MKSNKGDNMQNKPVHLNDILIRYFAMPNCRKFTIGDLEQKPNSRSLYKQPVKEGDKAAVVMIFEQTGLNLASFILENEIEKLCNEYELESECRANRKPITVDQELSKPYIIRIRKRGEVILVKNKVKAKSTTY